MDNVILMSAGGSRAEEEGNLVLQLFQDLVSSIFDGGVNRGLIVGMHGSFAGLVLVLVGLWVLTDFNGHVLTLTAISLCLWGTTGWFVSELLAAQRAQTADKAKADEAARAAAAAAGKEDDDPTTATTTATEGSGAPVQVVSKEAAIAQFKKAVSEAKKTK